MRIVHGDVWLTDFGQPLGREQGGLRPIVILSGPALNDVPAGLVLAAPVTTTDRGWPSHVEIGPEAGLDKPSWAMVEQFRSLSVRRLRHRIGSVDEQALARMGGALRHLMRP
ncbi:type II toxin-antitoxin system PemK/MazF family toxin [Microbispora sp. ATCC PTA-5024]|uniref:type II toxin-antitoxin system PemK/MazF family toxin n=1 Tax=Microbispora sp. ATCC PTA-5024 TaxID=316330 RepID=UPI0003DD2351|nr:type II toxin-antitoxin system PemK/MazF family toxin [Microbispora sp. ATCC PTA-5024]ETK32446.1 hypothetical protein MPTA5024_29820 [Microbispora sp. ATCC PTA-5024]